MTTCLVTDRRQLSPDARTTRDEALALVRWLEEAVAAGLDMIQLRERDLPARLLVDVARSVRQVLSGTTTQVLVNDRADVALVAQCDGVHVRGDGPAVARVAAVGSSSPAWMVGRSVHSVEEARDHSDAAYVMFGAVFASAAKPARGIDALRAVVAATSRPVLAIGGMTPARATACVSAGAAGVAAIGLFLPPGRATGALGLVAGAAALRRAIDPAASGHLQ